MILTDIRVGFYVKSSSPESQSLTSQFFTNTQQSIEFFQIEFYRIYRICRRLFLVYFIFKIKKKISTNPLDSVDSIEFNSE